MSNKNWIAAVPYSTVPEDDVTSVAVAGHEIALYRVKDEVFATSNICSHGRACMSDGYLDGYEIECPLHQGRFDVRTGKMLCEPLTEDIRSYPVRIEEGQVFLLLD